MSPNESLLFTVLVMLFGGFLWLKPGTSGLNGYWIMVAGLLLGTLVVAVTVFDRSSG